MMDTPVPVTTLLAGRYRVVELLAEGGTATVWRGVDEVLRRPVAIKRLDPEARSADPATTDRFLREAQIMAAVRHRCVATVLDFGVQDEEPFLVMELLDGLPLDERHPPGTATAAETVAIASGLLAGLAAIHEAGIVHRDLKPANILMVETPEGPLPVIVDFGIARSMRPATELRSVRTTEQGIVHGTPRYMSPEQARGFETDARSDVFSVGALLFELLSGSAPFDEGDPMRTLVAVATRPAPTLRSAAPGVPSSIAATIDRALLPAAVARFQTANEMRDALLRAAAPHPDLRDALTATYEPGDSGLFAVPEELTTTLPTQPPPSFSATEDEPASRSPRHALTGALGVLLAIAVALGLWSLEASPDGPSVHHVMASTRTDDDPPDAAEPALPSHAELRHIVGEPGPAPVAVPAAPSSTAPAAPRATAARRARAGRGSTVASSDARRARPSIVLDPGF